MQVNELIWKLDAQNITVFFNKLKEIYKTDAITSDRANEITAKVRNYGYLPYSHIKALEELTPAETIIGLEEKFKKNNTYNGNCFEFSYISPVKRAGYNDSSWIKREQHSIKLINLAALGNGNQSHEPAKFIDWLKQLLILPAGNVENNILSTTMYVIPFHPREFGCAYLPTSSAVSPNLADNFVCENLGINVKQQIQFYFALVQLAGHPTMYDVLPQTGRFSKAVLSRPYLARWFDIKELLSSLSSEIELMEADTSLKEILINKLKGQYESIPESLKDEAEKIEELLDIKRKEFSQKMLKRQNQRILHRKAKEIIDAKAGFEIKEEEDIPNQGEIIGELISQGMWPAPGGAWCSAGIPIFDKMSEGAGYPMFKHFDHKENDVTHFANLDCQTPYYFVNLENATYNQEVIEFYIEFLKKLQMDYNFDSFRVDHIDHIVDSFSESEDLFPISYRAPRTVLGKANTALKKTIPHFATLAEYMLWDNFLKEYHDDMDFDLLWGSDIVSQNQKTPSRIVEDNEQLHEYNSDLKPEDPKLSILKTYNNQDGEFSAINQYPGQLGEQGALFKWFKFKFLPGGENASRPVLYIDGDESFTKTGVEYAIGHEESMKRNNNNEFYEMFDSINRFALNNKILVNGKAEIFEHDEETGFISWVVKAEDENEQLFIVANEQPTTEIHNIDGEFVEKKGNSITDLIIKYPEHKKIVGEYNILNNSLIEKSIEFLKFDNMKPSEFHVFVLR